MLLSPPVRPGHADKIAGVVHVDGTACVQTVGPCAVQKCVAAGRRRSGEICGRAGTMSR
ncbi:hypothetical protein [Streptomyces sp. NPDC005970]|uniref:hypothetical protein n=1 Tax=Streptomyces sp. NPDC005970 TaxID=3156723 RepID=UPI0033EE4D8F